MLKIIFTDIDGTLLNKERETSTGLRNAVQRINQKEIPLILISSRMPSAMYHIQEDLKIQNKPLICYNGGLVLADGKCLHSCEIPVSTIEKLAELNTDKTIHISLYNEDNWYVEEMDYWAKREQNNTKVTPSVKSIEAVITDWKKEEKGAHKIMCMGAKEGIDKLVKGLETHFGESLHLYRSKDTYLEIANKEISKLTGINTLLTNQYPTLSLENCIAFGDNYNDIEMLDAVKVGVAVENAKPEVLEVANVVTASNHADGVAKSLGEYF